MRDVTRLRSTTTFSSTQFAPAFFGGLVWRRATAQLLNQFRADAANAGSEEVLGMVPTELADGSIALIDDAAIAGSTGNASAADFGDAADAGD